MQVSFLLYIIPWQENKSEKENRSKNKNDFLVAVAHFIDGCASEWCSLKQLLPCLSKPVIG